MIPVSTVSYRFDLLGPIMQHSELLAPYIAHLVMPAMPVTKLAGAIPTFLYSDAQIFNIVHAKGARFSRIISKVDTKTFACTENGIEEPLTVQDYDMLSRDVAHQVVATKLADIVMRQRENTLASSLMGSAGETTFTGQVTDGVNAWDGSSGDPFANIADAKVALNKRIGHIGDTLVMSYAQYMKLMKNAKFQSQVRAVLGYSGEFAMIAIKLEQDPQMIADVFGVRKIFVGRGTYNTANEGQTASYSEIWPTAYALLCKTYDGPNSPLPGQLGLGRMFAYETANELGQLSSGTLDAMRALVIEQYPEAQTNSDVLRAREFTGFSLLSTACGQLIKNV